MFHTDLKPRRKWHEWSSSCPQVADTRIRTRKQQLGGSLCWEAQSRGDRQTSKGCTNVYTACGTMLAILGNTKTSQRHFS